MRQSHRLICIVLLLIFFCVGGALIFNRHLNENSPVAPKKTTHSNSGHRNNEKRGFQPKRKLTDASDIRTVTIYLKKNHFVGSALIVKNDRFLYRKAFGYANYDQHIKNKTTSQFQILSIQKSLTAACIMKLIQEKRLSLKTPLSRFYPHIPNSNHIRIRNVLDMNSGLSMNGAGSNKQLSERKVVRYATNHLLSHERMYGQWRYQPVNYVLLAGIISRLMRTSYHQYFDKTLIKPLKLKNSGFVQNQPLTANKTMGYCYLSSSQVTPNYQKPFQESLSAMNNELGTGQVYMSAFDLFKVEHALLRGKIISSANVKRLHKPGNPSTYGGGVYNQSNGIRSHGVGYGYEASILISRNGKTGVVLLSNDYRPAVSIQDLAITLFDKVMTNRVKPLK